MIAQAARLIHKKGFRATSIGEVIAASGETHHLLPVPSVFVVGVDGIIRFSYSNPDYKIRIDPGDLVAAARAALDATP